ncbi:MAG: alpha-mannosidase [Herbinix sp.]|jgi:alpha-mannosidase|nr:alpha-mannosidase [Herbinix sp.]
MPYPINEIKPNIENALHTISNHIYESIAPLSVTMWKTKEPVPFNERTTGEMKEISIGESWGDVWDCAWFHMIGEVPASAAGKKVVLLIDFSGEACIFDSEGCPIQGLTNVSSGFDFSLGKPGKRVVDLSTCAKGEEKIDLWADAGCNDLFGSYRDHGILKEAHVAICKEEMRQLSYDFEVLYKLWSVLPENSSRAKSILHSLNKAALLLNEYTEEEATKAREILAKELNKKGGDPSLRMSTIGHAHIDLAWLWPIRETKRKGARTFSTAIKMMEKYPEYVFGASQAQLYDWIKENHPALYEKIRERIKEGRWEAQGGMWVEADTNISGGEALVRQIMYGKRFFEQEFQKDMRVLWLPDVFGYTGSLPQLLKKAGIDYFMTIKLSWSAHNKFPHHTFKWSGIDGSEVLTHMPPEGTYNSAALPTSIKRAEEDYQDSGVAKECLMLFGIGDGGGGPGEEHLERLLREKNLDGIIPVTQECSIDFFDRLKEDWNEYKTWKGELYLEKHQGTFTTQARNKRFNRKLEIGLRELELIAVLAQLKGKFEYPAKELEVLWKEVLLYQFHDILPGSSIKRVYDETQVRYQAITEAMNELLQKAYQALLQDRTVAVNTLSWYREEWLKLKGQWIKAAVPALGYSELSDQTAAIWKDGKDYPKAEDKLLENELLSVKFNHDGSICSVFDKEFNREVLLPGQAGNRLSVYYDKGDAWDFSIQYHQRPSMEFCLESTQVLQDGPKAELLQTYTYGNSRLEQRVILMSGSRKLDFVTKVIWHESDKMLRTSFPVNVMAMEATCDIQFGNIKRPTHTNTGFDMAKQEICAHKWVDVSEPNYGVALLNDCKYGYQVSNNVLDLNLLRSPHYPDENADQGEHEFTYSLYPHGGNHTTGKVNQAAYELNMPLVLHESDKTSDPVLQSESFLEADQENIIVEAVKKAEDSDAIILRLYESHGIVTSAKIRLGVKPTSVKLVDLCEREINSLEPQGNEVMLQFKPFEVHTLKVEF